MIELQYLSTEFNKILGTNDFELYLNTSPISYSGSKTVCTLVALRMPFALGDVDSETLQLTFTFDLTVSDLEIRDRRLALIKEILGWKSFQVKTPAGETYNCDSFLEQQPAGMPRVDTGAKIQQIVVTGTCLVAVAGLGAVVSNRVRTEINGDLVRVIAANTTLSKATNESYDLTAQNTLTDVREVSRSNIAEYTLLYMGLPADRAFIRLIEGENGDLNKTFIVRRFYLDFEIEHTMKFLSGSILDQAGSYLIYKVTLQKVEI